MTALRLPVLRRNHALGGVAVLLTGLTVWPWLVSPTPAARPLAAAQPSAAARSLAPLPPLATFVAIVERPLFAPSRRPPPGISAIGPSIESRYRLLGIVGSGPKKKAFLAEGAHRGEIAEGDTLDGWTVKEIAQDRVLLSSPAGDASLKLKPAASEPAKP